MQRAEPQKATVQSQRASCQGGSLAVASPQGEQIAQLKSMMEVSPLSVQQGSMAEKVSKSAGQSTQRKLAAMVHDSPRQEAQRKLIDGIHNPPQALAQRKSIEGIQSPPALQAHSKIFDGSADAVQRIDDGLPLQRKLDAALPLQFVKPNLGQNRFAALADDEEESDTESEVESGNESDEESGNESQEDSSSQSQEASKDDAVADVLAGIDDELLIDEQFIDDHYAENAVQALAIHRRRNKPVCTVIDEFYRDALLQEIKVRNRAGFFDNRRGNKYKSNLVVNVWEFHQGSDKPSNFSCQIVYAVQRVPSYGDKGPVDIYILHHFEERVK